MKISDAARLQAAGVDTSLVAQRATEAYLMQVCRPAAHVSMRLCACVHACTCARVHVCMCACAMRLAALACEFSWYACRANVTVPRPPARQILRHGFFHADPHPGNVAVDAHSGRQPVLLFYGARRVKPTSCAPFVRHTLFAAALAPLRAGSGCIMAAPHARPCGALTEQ